MEGAKATAGVRAAAGMRATSGVRAAARLRATAGARAAGWGPLVLRSGAAARRLLAGL